VSSPKQAERRELWRQRIAEQKNCGQTVRAFCREHELSEHSFYQWRRKLDSGGEQAVRFALVETPAPTGAASPRQGQLELVLNSGERLLIPAEAGTLRLVLSALRQAE
jgi:transposase-like protein